MLELKEAVFAQGTFELRADWRLEQGACASVIGPSGAGKSTLLAGIAGFAETVSGAVLHDGMALPDRPDARPIAMLFQDHNLFPHLTVAQNVALGIKPSLRISAQERARIDKALSEVGLDGYADRKPGALSGGQQSRAALARVLVQARPIILLDEPFAALGPALREEMLRLVREVAERLGATLLMVTHDVGDARRLGGQAVFVDAGVAQAPVPIEDLLARPPEALSVYLGSHRPE